jgi:hypothetical protein
LLTAGALTLASLFFATWQAGKMSGELEQQRLRLDLTGLKQKVARNELQLQQQKQQTEELRRALSKAGHIDAITLLANVRKQLLQSQAEANQYKQVIELEHQALKSNTELLDALSSPGAHLLPLKGADVAADSTAYALIVESSRILFVASNLPKPPAGKQYQLWVMRRQEPKLVSAGVFTPDDDKRAVMDFLAAAIPSVLSDISALEVTQEPSGGSEVPTGSKLFASFAEKSDRSE